ncbi:putative eukaryotic translation initiation factor subunit eif-4f [Balamuthia mandrillaris]
MNKFLLFDADEPDRGPRPQKGRAMQVDLSRLKRWSEFLYKASVAAGLEEMVRRVFAANGEELKDFAQLRKKISERVTPLRLIITAEVDWEPKSMKCLVERLEKEEKAEEEEMKRKKEEEEEKKAEEEMKRSKKEEAEEEKKKKDAEDAKEKATAENEEKANVGTQQKEENEKEKQERTKDKGKEKVENYDNNNADNTQDRDPKQLNNAKTNIRPLTELCLKAAQQNWTGIAHGILRLAPELQDFVVEYMWRNGVFEEMRNDEHTQKEREEMFEMNSFLDDLLMSSDEEEDEEEDEESDEDEEEEESGASSSSYLFYDSEEDEEEGERIWNEMMRMDEGLARTLQRIEEEAVRNLQRMEEQDALLARRLLEEEQQERAKGTAVEKQKETESLIKQLEEEERREAQERRQRELKDEEMAKLLAAHLEEEERGRKDSERKLRELEDERLARELEKQMKRVGEVNNKDEELAKVLQLEEETQLKAEIEEARKKEEELSRQFIEKLLVKSSSNTSSSSSTLSTVVAADSSLTAPITSKYKARPRKYWQEMETQIYQEAGPEDWKSSSFLSNTQTLEQYLNYKGGNVTVKKVMKPALIKRFEQKWLEFKKKYGSHSNEAQPCLAFHGTRSHFIPSIVSKGLLVPESEPGVKHVTDSGWYGKGIYLSPDPSVSESYALGGKMLVCSVLMGRIYRCPARCDGAGCRPGYDSHLSPSGEEYVLFSAAQVLPCYLVEFHIPETVHSAGAAKSAAKPATLKSLLKKNKPQHKKKKRKNKRKKSKKNKTK